MTETDVLLQQTEDGHHRFVDAPADEDGVSIVAAMAHQQMTVGSQVELKSGGPVMTVDWWQDDIVNVVWFVGGTASRDGFHWSMLKLAEPKEQK